MRILFDHQCFVQQQFGGVSRYHYQLIKELNKLKDVESELSLKYSNNFYINEDKSFKVKRFFPKNKFYFKRTILDYLNRLTTNQELKNRDYDVFHPTYYNPYFVKQLNSKPFVVTVYDTIHEIYPEIANSIDQTLTHKKEILSKADRIIAISNNTKNDLIRLYCMPDERIEVVYIAATINKSMISNRIKEKLPDKYLLYVGNRNFYKNFKVFLSSIEEILRNDSKLFLVLAGGEIINAEELALFTNKKIKDKIIPFPADDVTLAALYTNAVAFIFPTLYEGFGIPVLEAMNCDCPVIMSNTSSLPEVGGDAAIYFDPNDLDDMRHKIEMVVENHDLRNDLIKKGRIQRQKFSFEKTAIQTLEVYKRVLANK